MKKIFFLILLIVSVNTFSQTKKSAIPAMPDVSKLLNMSPAELEAYKKQLLLQKTKEVRANAAKLGLKVDEMSMPDYEATAPKLNKDKLEALPKTAPALSDLLISLNNTKTKVEAIIKPAELHELKSMIDTLSGSGLNATSVVAFYSGKPAEGILLSIHSILKDNTKAVAWNNLAAMYNMSGLQHKAIPILMNLLEKNPKSSMLLNNMGQAYLGLGHLQMAQEYLTTCLQQNSGCPEANMGLGIIELTKGNTDNAMSFFEKEMQIAYKKSIRKLMSKKQKVLNIYNLRKRRGAVPHKNFYDEVQLSKFKVPDFPMKTDENELSGLRFSAFQMSVYNEVKYWSDKTIPTQEMKIMEGKHVGGMYDNMVRDMWKDLHEIYTPYELSLVNDIHVNQLKAITKDYYERLNNIKCPEPRSGESALESIARLKICCDQEKQLTDGYLAQFNSLITARVNAILPIWKSYVNDAINVLSLEPCSANKRLACEVIGGYFSFLLTVQTYGVFMSRTCNPSLTPEEAQIILESARDFDFNCPQQLNVSINLGVAKLKGDCNKFEIEAGKGIRGSFSHSFKTGSSTIAVGVGADGKLVGVLSGTVKQMVYLTVDANGQFEDLGLKGTAEVSVGATLDVVGIKLSGVEAGYSLGINSGFNPSATGKGALAGLSGLK